MFLEDSPVGESQSNGVVENAVGRVQGQTRTIRFTFEGEIPLKIEPDVDIWLWMIEFGADIFNRCRTGIGGRTPCMIVKKEEVLALRSHVLERKHVITQPKSKFWRDRQRSLATGRPRKRDLDRWHKSRRV